jgi:hypothetical protein
LKLVFVNPVAGLAFLAVLLPLAAFWRVRRRGRRVRAAVGLGPPPRRSGVLALTAIVLLAALVGAASAQPVVVDSQPRYVREDAEAYFVVDITRSMLASASATGPTRLERARVFAARVRAAVPDVPTGIASFTNRLVPHVFPTPSLALFGSGLRRSIAIERPAPDRSEQALVTAFDSLAPLHTHNFFSPAADRRVAVVLTDGETQPVSPATLRALRAQPRIALLIVRFWSERERIFRPRLDIDAQYEADPGSTATLAAFADGVGARVFGEDDAGAVARELRRLVGRGELAIAGEEVSARPLTAWTVALALVPLGFLLARRNAL